MSRLLDGRTALVTGSARGIGLATARALAQNGAKVVLTDLDESVLRAAEAQLQALELDVVARRMDVSSHLEVESVAREFERVDVLVNNAARLDTRTVQQITLEGWRAVLEVNLTSALAVVQTLLPALRRAASASIVNVASTQALFGQSASVAYASAKGGLTSLTRCMAVDLAAEGIRANAVAPGFIDTRMALTQNGLHEHELAVFKDFYIAEGKIPLRRGGTPEDVADVIVFFASDLSRYVTGQTLAVDGGLTATY